MRAQDFVVTAQLPLRPSMTREKLRANIAELQSFVDAVQISDNRMAEGHMDVLAAASIALDCGVDPIFQLCCRDRNRIALKSALLGAAALGVTSLVLTRGQKMPDALRGEMKSVFDTKVTQLIEIARYIGDNTSFVDPPGFYVGAMTPVIRPNADWRAPQIEDKISAGIQFLQIRPCFNPKPLRSYMAKLVSLKILHRVSVLVEVPLLTSAKMATDLKDSLPGVRIPSALIARIADAPDPAAEGIRLCAEVLAQLPSIPGVSGANIVYDDDVAHIVDAIQQASI